MLRVLMYMYMQLRFSVLKLTQALLKVMQFISCITLAYVAAWFVGAVMITASIVNSTLVNV